MLSIQNSSQMNQISNFKARKFPKKPRNLNLKQLRLENENYVKNVYPKEIAKLHDAFANYKIGYEEFRLQLDKHFNKLLECTKHLGK